MTALNVPRPTTIRYYIQAGLLAGVVAAILNIIVYLIMLNLGGHSWAAVVVGSIFVASLLPNLLAALLYFALGRLTRHARPLLTVGVIAFVLISVLPHLGIGPAPSPALAALPEGFDLITVPLHLVFGLTSIFLMPRFIKKQ